MRDPEQLKASLANVEEWIRLQLTTEITRPYKDCEHLGKILWGLQSFYRVRGILRFLIDGDASAFFSDQAREALTYLTFLRAHEAGYDVPDARVKGSTYAPLACAIVSGDFRLVGELDALMPRALKKQDGKPTFAFASALRRLAMGPEEEVEQTAQAVAEACAESERWAPVIGAVEGLAHRDEESFNEGLTTYLTYIDEMPAEEATELRPGEEYVSIEGLALTQLAKKRKVRQRVKHRLIPTELQNPTPVTPKDGFPAWPG